MPRLSTDIGDKQRTLAGISRKAVVKQKHLRHSIAHCKASPRATRLVVLPLGLEPFLRVVSSIGGRNMGVSVVAGYPWAWLEGKAHRKAALFGSMWRGLPVRTRSGPL